MDDDVATALGASVSTSSASPFGASMRGVSTAKTEVASTQRQLNKEDLRHMARVDGLEEIERRAQVAPSKATKRMVMRKYDNVDAAFAPLPEDVREDPVGQLLFMVAGPGHTRPACANVGLNVLCYFGGVEEAVVNAEMVAYAQRVIAPQFNACDLRAMPIDKWVLLTTAERMADEQYCMRTMQTNMERYYERLRQRQSSFVRRVETATGQKAKMPTVGGDGGEGGEEGGEGSEVHEGGDGGDGGVDPRLKMQQKRMTMARHRLPTQVKEKASGKDQLSLFGLNRDGKPAKVSKRKQARQAMMATELKNWDVVPSFPSGLLRRSQACAAVCFLEDLDPEAQKGRKDPEHMVRVLKFYGSVADAQEDIAQNLKECIADFDIDVVDLGEWLFPADVNYDALENFQYRDEEQNNIMKRRVESRREVRAHERKCKGANLDAQEIFMKSAEEAAKVLPPDEYFRAGAIDGTATTVQPGDPDYHEPQPDAMPPGVSASNDLGFHGDGVSAAQAIANT